MDFLGFKCLELALFSFLRTLLPSPPKPPPPALFPFFLLLQGNHMVSELGVTLVHLRSGDFPYILKYLDKLLILKVSLVH